MAGQGDYLTVYLYSIMGQGYAANRWAWVDWICVVKIRTIVRGWPVSLGLHQSNLLIIRRSK